MMNTERNNSEGSTENVLDEYNKTRQVFERYLQEGERKSGSMRTAIRHRNIKLAHFYTQRRGAFESAGVPELGIFATTQAQLGQDKRYDPSKIEDAIITIRVTSAQFEENIEIYPNDDRFDRNEKHLERVNEMLLPIRKILEDSEMS